MAGIRRSSFSRDVLRARNATGGPYNGTGGIANPSFRNKSPVLACERRVRVTASHAGVVRAKNDSGGEESRLSMVEV